MVAIEQRSVISGPIAEARRATEAAPEDIAVATRVLARHLAPHCTAMRVEAWFKSG